MELTVTLSEKDLKEIIKDHLEKKLGHEVKSVNVNVGNVSQGYGTNEYTAPGLKDVQVVLGEEKKATFNLSPNAFGGTIKGMPQAPPFVPTYPSSTLLTSQDAGSNINREL